MRWYKNLFLRFLITFLLFSCHTNEEDSIENWKDEIVKTEKEFAQMAEREGISEAFLYYAADDAVLMRNNQLIIGKESIKESYDQRYENVQLSWKPDFVDVAASGDLGYTYGMYEFILTDSLGTPSTSVGIFHTIWKRQKDGSWKFVWD